MQPIPLSRNCNNIRGLRPLTIRYFLPFPLFQTLSTSSFKLTILSALLCAHQLQLLLSFSRPQQQSLLNRLKPHILREIEIPEITNLTLQNGLRITASPAHRSGHLCSGCRWSLSLWYGRVEVLIRVGILTDR